MLGANKTVNNFHIQDRMLCHLGDIYIPSSDLLKLIWEAHYSQVDGHFGVEMKVAVL
jgi:hypothetical protein